APRHARCYGRQSVTGGNAMHRKFPILALLLVPMAGCVVQGTSAPAAAPVPAQTVASVFDGSRGQWVDLTHAFSEGSVYWPTDTQGFELEELAHGHTEGGWFYSSYRYSGAEHGGTHLDAPLHF